MAKITLNPMSGSYASVTSLNALFQLIEDAFNDDVFYRTNPTGEPNVLSNDLDMGNNEILNMAAPLTNNSPARLQDVLDASTSLVSTSAVATTISDSGAYYASANVEGALQEIGVDFADLYSTATAKGASLIGFEDSIGIFSGADVETALTEIPIILSSDNSVVEVTGTLTETTLFTSTIPANLPQANGILRLTIIGDYKNQKDNTVVVGFGIVFGGTTIVAATTGFGQFTSSANRRNVKFVIDIPVVSTTVQSALIHGVVSDDGAEGSWLTLSGGSSGIEKWLRDESIAEDLTTSTAITFSVKHNDAAATISFIKRSASLEYFPPH